MDPIWKVLELLLLLSLTSAYSMHVVDYISSLTRHLADREPGTFDCWFYETTTPTETSILDHIIAENHLAMIPQRMLYNVGRILIHRPPALLIINFTCKCFDRLVQFLIAQYHRATKMIVILDASVKDDLSYVVQLFEHFKLHDVIYVWSNSLKIHQRMAYQNEITTMLGPVPFGDLFKDPIGNLTGRTFHASHSSSAVESFQFEFKKAKSLGYNDVLFEEVVTRLGGRLQHHVVHCKPTESSEQCTRNLFWYNSTTEYDFSSNSYTISAIRNEHFITSIVPNAIIIVAPRGRRFTTFEVFSVPFRQELWFGFLAFLIICILLMTLQPAHFTNDLILLPICGFERREFHRVSPLEKTILITLIVIYFALLSAYEAKIVAFMTEFPHLPDPRTIDDLIRNNITIQQYGESWGKLMFEEDPTLKQLFAPSQFQSQIQWESQQHAFIGGGDFMNLILNHPDNYDPESGRQRLVVLREFTFGIRIMYIFCSRRHPLAPKIQRNEIWRFEAGLYDFWVAERTRTEFGIRRSANLYQDSVDVGMTELEPAWYILAVGLGSGCLALLLELAWKFKTRFSAKAGHASSSLE